MTFKSVGESDSSVAAGFEAVQLARLAFQEGGGGEGPFFKIGIISKSTKFRWCEELRGECGPRIHS